MSERIEWMSDRVKRKQNNSHKRCKKRRNGLKKRARVCVCVAKLVDDGERTAQIFNIGFTIIIIIVVVVIIDLPCDNRVILRFCHIYTSCELKQSTEYSNTENFAHKNKWTTGLCSHTQTLMPSWYEWISCLIREVQMTRWIVCCSS